MQEILHGRLLEHAEKQIDDALGLAFVGHRFNIETLI